VTARSHNPIRQPFLHRALRIPAKSWHKVDFALTWAQEYLLALIEKLVAEAVVLAAFNPETR
jgi:hypothetical protein